MNFGSADQAVVSNKLSGKFRSANACAPNVPLLRDRHRDAAVLTPLENSFNCVSLQSQSEFITVADFASLDDREFVEAAYRVLLKRPSDPVGVVRYTQMLAENSSKTEVLAALRYSQEGMIAGVRIDGVPSRLVFSKLYPLKSRILRLLQRGAR